MAGSETRVSDLDEASVIIPLDTRGHQLPPGSRERLLAETAGNPLAGVGRPVRPLRTELIEVLPHAGVQGFCEAGG